MLGVKEVDTQSQVLHYKFCFGEWPHDSTVDPLGQFLSCYVNNDVLHQNECSELGVKPRKTLHFSSLMCFRSWLSSMKWSHSLIHHTVGHTLSHQLIITASEEMSTRPIRRGACWGEEMQSSVLQETISSSFVVLIHQSNIDNSNITLHIYKSQSFNCKIKHLFGQLNQQYSANQLMSAIIANSNQCQLWLKSANVSYHSYYQLMSTVTANVS